MSVVSVTPLPSMATPIRSLPSAPLFEVVLQCVASASISAVPWAAEMRGELARRQICTLIFAATAKAVVTALVPSAGSVAIAQIFVGPGTWLNAIRIDLESGPLNHAGSSTGLPLLRLVN